MLASAAEQQIRRNIFNQRVDTNEEISVTRACIVGWAHAAFGKLDDSDVESLIAPVSGEALAHAGILETCGCLPVEELEAASA
jgi:hypothetical protein